MPATLFEVVSPILHPIAAKAGHALAWFPGVSIVVLRETPAGWEAVRRLPFDNAGALAGLMADGAIAPFSDAQAAVIRQLLPRYVQPRPAQPTPARTGER
jgi:hypothetical protein